MPKHHRFLDAHSAKTALMVIMQVRTTNTATLDLYFDLMRRQFGHCNGFNTQIMRSVHNNGFDYGT